MRRLAAPYAWLAVVLLLVAAGGAIALVTGDCIVVDEAYLESYWARHWWQCAFDALSATCGVGLLTYDLEHEYTPAGRWTLALVGVAGALAFIAAAAQAARRIATAGSPVRPPGPFVVVLLFVVVQVLVLGVAWVLLTLTGAGGFERTLWHAVVGFSSIGTVESGAATGTYWLVAGLGLLGALGWAGWLLVLPPLRRRWTHLGSLLLAAGTYVAFLLVVALAICALESPRGQGHGTMRGETLQTGFGQRYADSLLRTVSASGAGVATGTREEGDVTDGTRLALSLTLLVGGLGGAPGGGIRWPLLLAAAVASLGVFERHGRVQLHELSVRLMHAALASVVLVTSSAIVVAFGLLLLETRTASAYQAAPTFAQALLDASSAIAGGNLTDGMTERVTGRNLISGIRQGANLYQYGMVWLMAAMLWGRVLPVLVVARLARTRTPVGGLSGIPPV